MYTNVRDSWALMLLDPATGEQSELLERRGEVGYPEFSPTGDRILFFARNEADVHIFTIGIDGSALRQMTRGKELNITP